MEEESGVKAAVVTRLRRRLSTEAEGAQSPLTPSTPTKKRSTRLAKPALELIDENVTGSVQKKKSSAKDAEPVEETSVTPSRRSTRIRSNTSLLMEATQNIISDSPRAKRALRRNSQIGSDTETTTSTPARRTRTRKDSTSSVEKLAVTSSTEKIITQVAEPISEEPEKELPKENISQNKTPLRKSPRLNKNNKLTTGESETSEQYDNAVSNTPELPEEAHTNTSKLTKDTVSLNELTTTESTSKPDNIDNKSELKYSETPNLSIDSAKLIDEISDSKNLTNFNRTASAIDELSNDKGNRKRTKSWTTIPANYAPPENNSAKMASGDSIMEKMDIKSPNRSINKSTTIYNTSIENVLLKSPEAINATDTIKILDRTPVKDIRPVVVMEDSDSNSGSEKLIINMHLDESGKNYGGDQCVPFIKQGTPKRLASESFVVEPMDIDETIPENITINDFSDRSNSSKDENKVPDLQQNSSQSNQSSFEINKSPEKSNKTSSISLQQGSNSSKRKSSIRASEENNDIKDGVDELSRKSQRKSSISSVLYENDNSSRKSFISKAESENDKRKSSTSSQIDEKLNETSNKSKRKSITYKQQLDRTSDENKSTLVLSQLKDVSETNNVSKSPNDTNNDLSKSVNIPNKKKEKTNQSNYLTSTPLHQKPLQTLAIQINTSIISPNVENNKTSKANKSETSIKKASTINNDSDSSEKSDEDSRENSKMIDEEAEEASNNYESGDSRDEEEIQYEKDHEITEKGETLDSESDVSEDTDYEKDSFIVSSDEEDDSLLSGSGDDLSLSDNELKMTAKSKMKFDERKRKERKKASREMYESRHQLSNSEKGSKAKKLETSLEPEKKITQHKKKNRLRIDSSQDVTLNTSEADESITVKKKKVKRLSETMFEDNPNEKEITIQNQSITEKNDPLVVDVKEEPKTPQKDFNMSTVLINDNIEQVQVESNKTVMISNDTSDPLQVTQAHEEDSDSDISENMEIQENYDSVLANLNKSNNKKDKVKTHDVSLNLNKKAKDRVKEPIMDELNLTQTKTKKKKKIEKNTTEKSTNKIQDDDNSDAIDMQLLFPEDSNDSDVNATKKLENKEKPAEEFIPLKKADAKTNLRENMDLPEDSLGFFIDTKGDYGETDVTTQSSARENNKRKHNVSLDNVEAYNNFSGPENVSVIESPKKDKKKKKNKSFDVSQTNAEPVMNLLEISSRYEQSNVDFFGSALQNASVTSDKKKKKNKSQLDISEIVDTAQEETVQNDSMGKDKKKKKNKSQQDVSQFVEDAAPEETATNISVSSKKKKKKDRSHQDISQFIEDTATAETPENVSLEGNKKKKKNKSQLDHSQFVEDAAPEETPINVSMNNNKKKKKNKSLEISHVENTGEESDEAPMELAYKSEKRSNNPEFVEDDDTATISKNKFKKKKKKNKCIQPDPDTNPDHVEVKAKKRKHEDTSPTADGFVDEIISKSQKKKKPSQHDEGASTSKPNKRKASEDDGIQGNPKAFKSNYFQNIHVPRLPDSIVNQLDDQPAFDQLSKKSKKIKAIAIATMPFIVEEGPKKKNKPSNYLEQSVYLNDSISPIKQKKKIKHPKVLPFTPTVITSGEGYTSRFKINVLPQETQFVAQANNMTNFKDQYLSKQRTKKLRVENFKRQTNHRLAKF